MDRSDKLIPIINLIGDPEENFYQLGLKDREKYSETFDHLKALISTPWKPLNSTLEELGKLILKQGMQVDPNYRAHIQAYAGGLDRPFEEIALGLLLPELLSFMSKWIPGVSPTLLGCSSYFLWDDETSAPIHGRVLDFPLKGSYENNERAIHYKFNGQPEIFSYSTAGLPYPSLTAMTDQGVTFALHQKFSDVFDPKGTPVFGLIYQLLGVAHDKKSALDFLKKSRSITTWAFNMSFANGDVLSVDIMGDQLAYEEYNLEKEKIIYFNNSLIDKNLNQSNFVPYGLEEYNSMRADIAGKKIKKLLKKKSLSQLDLLKVMGTPHKQTLKNPANWKLDSITPSTVGLSTFSAVKGESLFIQGQSPKFYRKDYLSFQSIWERLEQKAMQSTISKVDETYMQGISELMQAQVSYDRHNTHLAYHHIQMAMDHLGESPEGYIARFYFNVFQYVHETKNLIRANMLKEFEELQSFLPPYLQDQCLLFISRLQRILSGHENIQADNIKNLALRKIYQKEKKIPNLLLHKTTSLMMSPRIDMLDIIYPHAKA